MNIMAVHRWNALGGWNTVFLAATTGYAAHTFGIASAPGPLATPLMAKSGLKSLARNTAVLLGPTTFGLALGICAFGDATELKHLLRFGRQYRGEFSALRKELYYQ